MMDDVAAPEAGHIAVRLFRVFATCVFMVALAPLAVVLGVLWLVDRFVCWSVRADGGR